jgi:hypothetical protein
MALEVPIYLRQVLPDIFVINVIFDIATWSATVCGLRFISTARGRYAVLGVILGIAFFSLLILKLFQALYFSLSVAYSALHELNWVFDAHYYMSTFMISLRTEGPFNLDIPFIIRYTPPYPPIQISVIALTKFAALEALIPTALFVTACLLGSAVYSTRRFTQKPVGLVVERLAASKNVCVTIASLLSGVIAILKVLLGSST